MVIVIMIHVEVKKKSMENELKYNPWYNKNEFVQKLIYLLATSSLWYCYFLTYSSEVSPVKFT